MNKRKENYQNALASFKKSSVTNLMALVSFYAIDFIAIMLQINSNFNADKGKEIDLLVMYWAIGSMFVLVLLTYLVYRCIKNDNYDRARLLMLVMLVITIVNMLTYVFAGFVYSIILVVPIIMLVYVRENLKRAMNTRI